MANSVSGSSELWQALVGTALMGTDRQKPNLPQTQDDQDALATVVSQLDWQQSEQALLGAAGAITLHRQVGQIPRSQSQELPALATCGVDDMPCCGDRTARHLNQVLESQTELLPELLGLIAVAGQRVPEMLLPKLLQAGQKSIAMRPAILAVLGERGRWLAGQNAAWRYGQGEARADFETETPELKALWPEEDAQSRALTLRAWRQVDAQAAREALEAVWFGELAKERLALLAALETNLSLDDEVFLEEALEDKGKNVRRLAADLLAQLSGSGYCDRMVQRAQTSVEICKTQAGVVVTVTLPETYGDGWKRDGLELKPPKGEGQRAWWLRQLLAATPLDVWRVEPEIMAQAIERHEWQDTLLRGWGLAAQRQGNAAWAEAILQQFGLRQFSDLQFVDLLSLMSPEIQERFWRDLLSSATSPGKQPKEKAWEVGMEQLSQTQLPLSADFSQWLIQQLKSHLQGPQKERYQVAYSARGLAQMLHPDTASEFAEMLEVLSGDLNNTYRQNALQNIWSCFSFRREMHQAFDASG